MDKKTGFEVLSSTDYDKFILVDGNREIGAVRELMDSMNHIGIIPIPIIVNEKWEIIDGQHRFTAWVQMNKPILYAMVEGLTVEACPWLNRGQKNWKSKDYMHLYASLGNENYRLLSELVDAYKGNFSLEDILCFVLDSGVTGGFFHKFLRDEKLRLTADRAELISLRLATAINLDLVTIQRQRGLSKRSWWSAVSYAFKHPDISIKELSAKLKSNPLELASYSKTEDMLRVFDEINNKGKKKKTFMSSDYQQGKYKDN